jgi:hypothetical protein
LAAAPVGQAKVAATELLLPELARKGIHNWRIALPEADASACSSEDGPMCVHLVHTTDPVAACGREGFASQFIYPTSGLSPEAFALCATASAPRNGIVIAASTELGLMMGCGHFLRELGASTTSRSTTSTSTNNSDDSSSSSSSSSSSNSRSKHATVPANLSLLVSPPPWAMMRGHQLTDWGFYMTDKAMEQFIRDLIVFGTNQVEYAHISYARGAVFHRNFHSRNAIGSHACSLEASRRVTNDIILGCSLFLPVHIVNRVRTQH